MSKYYHDPAKVPSLGRKLSKYPALPNVASLSQRGEVLIGCFDNGLYTFAMLMNTQEEVQTVNPRILPIWLNFGDKSSSA